MAARRAWGREVRVFSHPARTAGWSPRRWWATAHSRRIVLSEHAKLLYYALRRWI
jgi:hypothetical protein